MNSKVHGAKWYRQNDWKQHELTWETKESQEIIEERSCSTYDQMYQTEGRYGECLAYAERE